MIVYIKKRSLYTILIALIFLSGCNSNKNESATTENIKDSTWLLPFEKLDSVNPVMQPGDLTFICPVQNKPVKWEAKNVYNPAVAVKDDTLFMLYRAQDSAGCSRVGVAKSIDGIHFTRYASPAL